MAKETAEHNRPDPPKRMLWPFSTIYNKVVSLYNLAKDILNVLLVFKDEALLLLHKIHHQTKQIPILLSEIQSQAVTLKRLEHKVNEMALNFDKLNEGVTALSASQDALVVAQNEIVAEFKLLKDQITDPAAQGILDSFGDKLNAAAAAVSAQAQAFRDINPDLPPPPPPGGPTPSSRRRG